MRHRHTGRLATFAAFALAAFVAACGKEEGGEGSAAAAGPLPPGFTAIAADARLEIPVRPANCYAAPVRKVFRNELEWVQYWTNERRGCTAPPVPAGIDFSRDMLLFAAMGKRMSEHDRISIDATSTRPDTLLIFVRRSMQESGCSGRTATFPQSLVKVPASGRYVKFNEEHRRIPCGS
ncbi:MAG TPA: hypothetical protein VFS20_23875 [Longimicrobium sp.]|nr:hypothetical protein [Longimicrobium sp.]